MKIDLVDVFGSAPLRGNPLGVVHGAGELDDAQMLALTRWLGFSETTFLLPPRDSSADYLVRIFTPRGELPFAGHPTLGSCHAWLAAGGVQRRKDCIIQECGIGLVKVQVHGDLLAFEAPPLIRSGPLSPAERAEAIRLTGVDEATVLEAVHLANGPNWQLLRLRSQADVLNARPAANAPDGTDIGLAAARPAGSETDWELRAFFANQHGQLVEDPVTGSFNAGLALHLFGNGLAQGSYTAAQGRMTGADGRVHCSIDDAGAVWIGGRVALIAGGGQLAI